MPAPYDYRSFAARLADLREKMLQPANQMAWNQYCAIARLKPRRTTLAW